MKELLTGNQSAIKGALAVGAEIMTGYPITPTTEMLEYWAEEANKNPALKFLQSEDEMAAGFAMIGAILAGKKAFSATAGPGNILMQDAFAMAENMRLPTVAFINQRGGPSTGTVIYSQQELNLTCFGGNGEGLRIVYSCAGVQDMYDYAIKAFNTAWRYRFPTFMLSDGYQGKMKTEIETYSLQEKQIENIPAYPYLLNPANKETVNLRNTYNLEKDLNYLIEEHKKAFDEIVPEIIEFEDLHTLDAEIVIFAHGIIASASKQAIDSMRSMGVKVGLFRPITLNPFPKDNAISIAKNKRLILVIESSLGQFERVVKENLYGLQTKIIGLKKPALGISPEEIISKVNDILKEQNG
ncbi:MAG: 2-oxoglutarate synthase KorA [Berkelbacteria bacterium GW2011_GWB1_38_5]|uniref:2-oxoglutarate synthase KorA n=2 Tax=Candidatus Berkelbacteria TaxID=1618330 RepID=A0A0G0NYI4_9BACT|nr:MAG: 2-oxoglutarate synthase KorA [Berkelbacteria bacterium GW2011_GWB1_38_5]KKQ90929.1 MAG: 2-oxoglutarate synthase KorA [Berkelbacteria bacterium GW2011_GWA1_39_10]